MLFKSPALAHWWWRTQASLADVFHCFPSQPARKSLPMSNIKSSLLWHRLIKLLLIPQDMENTFVDSFLPCISRLILSPASASCSLSHWGPETEALTKIHQIPGDFNKEVTLCKVLSATFSAQSHLQSPTSKTQAAAPNPPAQKLSPGFSFQQSWRGTGTGQMQPQRSHRMSLLKATSRDPTFKWRDSLTDLETSAASQRTGLEGIPSAHAVPAY